MYKWPMVSINSNRYTKYKIMKFVEGIYKAKEFKMIGREGGFTGR
jgi:hypothetical protein